MFPSAAASDRWRLLDSAPSTSSAAVIPGRKRKANYSSDEMEALVWNVVQHFGPLFGSDNVRAHPERRRQLWAQIQNHVNLLGYTQRSVDDLKHKWRDLRLDVKKKIMANKSSAAHGIPCKPPQLTPLEKKVASTFLQPTHDPEPEIVLDTEICSPGTPKRRCRSMQAATSHPDNYTDTKEQLSTQPEMEEFDGPHLVVGSPDPSVIGDYRPAEEQNSSADSDPELQISETSTFSPPLINDSLPSEEEDAEGQDGDEGLPPPFSAEKDLKFSNQQPMALRHYSSRESPTSEPEAMLTSASGHSEGGHSRGADLPVLGPQTQKEESEPPNADLGSFPRGRMGLVWGKQLYERQRQQLSTSPHGTETRTEESLPPVSSDEDRVSPSHSLLRRIRASRRRERRRKPSKATVRRLMEMERHWDHLYHHELAVWQGERVQQLEERGRDQGLQLQLLAVLTEIRDELRCMRQERATSCQEFALQTSMGLASPSLFPKPEESLPKPPSEQRPLFCPGKPESWSLAGTSFLSGGQAERGVGLQSPQGGSRRGRGRPRGSTSRHRRWLVGNR